MSLIDRGALGGDVIDAAEMDGGNYQQTLDAAASTVACDGAMKAVRRAVPKAAAAVLINGALKATLRMAIIASSTTAINGAMTSNRRTRITALAATAAADAAAVVGRRARFTAAGGIDCSGAAATRYVHLRRAPPDRTFFVPHENRTFVVPSRGAETTLERRRPILIPREKRGT